LCPFKQYAFQSSVASSVSAHLSRKHRTAGIDDLRSEIIADCSAGGTGVELDVEDRVIDDNTVDEDEANTASSWSAGEPELPDSVLTERELLRLFVKMNTVLHVPRYAVQELSKVVLSQGLRMYVQSTTLLTHCQAPYGSFR